MKFDALSASSASSGLALAARIIGKADRAHPADAVLRAELKAANQFLRADAREASRAVFAWFRWRGWMEPECPLPAQIKHALQLATSLAEHPQSFPDEAFAGHAITGVDWRGDGSFHRLGAFTAIGAEALAARETWAGPGARREDGRLLDSAGAGFCGHGGVSGRRGFVSFAGISRGRIRATRHRLTGCRAALRSATRPDLVGRLRGEGGKLLHLSELMENKGLIWASDRAEWRLKNLKRRTARAKCFNYRAAHWDGGAKLPTKTKFDGVLVDAPCSGLGTWQRNPHARWTTTPEDVRELGALQRQLLSHAAGSVKPGGKLVYSVCTLTRPETTAVAEAFQQAHPDFEPATLPSLAVKPLPPTAALTIWPQDLAGNGMFVASWRRK